MGRGPYRPSNQSVSVQSTPYTDRPDFGNKNPYMDATIGAITNPGMAGPTNTMERVDDGTITGINGGSYKPGSDQSSTPLLGGLGGGASSGSSSRGGYDQKLLDQFDAIGKKNGRTWRDDEYAQWLGPNGYLMKDDINGQGAKIGAWSGGEIDPYWQWRIGTHARGDYNGDNPAELGAGDANTNKGKGNQANAAMTATAGTDGLLSGDPFARIQDALGKVNGQGQVNLDALLKQLGA